MGHSEGGLTRGLLYCQTGQYHTYRHHKMSNIVCQEFWTDEVKFFLFILAEFNDNWSVSADLNRLIKESLLSQ